jgi:hypothetical protein
MKTGGTNYSKEFPETLNNKIVRHNKEVTSVFRFRIFSNITETNGKNKHAIT